MVRLTPDHWAAMAMRADGHTYATIALEQDCSLEQARQRVEDVAKVIRLRLIHEAGGGVGAEEDSSRALRGS